MQCDLPLLDFSLPKFYRKNQLREVAVGGFSIVPNFTYIFLKIWFRNFAMKSVFKKTG